MGTPKGKNWLLSLRPPGGWAAVSLYTKKMPCSKVGERLLWWGILRQAARDVLHGHRSIALDGLEFLSSTGEWVSEELFGISTKDYRDAVVSLVMQREREKAERLVYEATEDATTSRC